MTGDESLRVVTTIGRHGAAAKGDAPAQMGPSPRATPFPWPQPAGLQTLR